MSTSSSPRRPVPCHSFPFFICAPPECRQGSVHSFTRSFLRQTELVLFVWDGQWTPMALSVPERPVARSLAVIDSVVVPVSGSCLSALPNTCQPRTHRSQGRSASPVRASDIHYSHYAGPGTDTRPPQHG